MTDDHLHDEDAPPTMEELLAAKVLAWANEDGSAQVRVADDIDHLQAARVLRHLADHVDPDVTVMEHP